MDQRAKYFGDCFPLCSQLDPSVFGPHLQEVIDLHYQQRGDYGAIVVGLKARRVDFVFG
jgi:hypothetical protein